VLRTDALGGAERPAITCPDGSQVSLPKLLPMEDSGWRASRPGTGTQRDAPLRRVNPDVARDIAQWFLEVPVQGGKRLVTTAYQGPCCHDDCFGAPAQLKVRADAELAILTYQ